MKRGRSREEAGTEEGEEEDEGEEEKGERGATLEENLTALLSKCTTICRSRRASPYNISKALSQKLAHTLLLLLLFCCCEKSYSGGMSVMTSTPFLTASNNTTSTDSS